MQFKTLYTYIRESFFQTFLNLNVYKFFSLDSHYQKIISEFFKKKRSKVYDFHM